MASCRRCESWWRMPCLADVELLYALPTPCRCSTDNNGRCTTDSGCHMKAEVAERACIPEGSSIVTIVACVFVEILTQEVPRSLDG